MNKGRKPLSDILGKYNENGLTANSNSNSEISEFPNLNEAQTSDSLAAKLAHPKKKPTKIRFTLDLEKSLDDRLNKSAKNLNRSKADLTRIALERLLEELEQEGKQ